jgi:flagellar assembly factor FliW
MNPAPAVAETEITVSEAVTFPDGIPGFETCRSWVVMAAESATPLRRLHAMDGADASFLAIDPRAVLDNYRCELSASDLRRLGAGDNDSLLWLAIVMMEPGGALTVNLRAPIVINPRRMVGCQFIRDDHDYPVHLPLGKD